MTNSAQTRIIAMENALKAHMTANGREYAHVSVHVMATSRGWVVYIDSTRADGYFDALDRALDAAEAQVRAIVNANDNLAKTLGIAS